MGCKELPGDLQLRNAAVPLSSSASILINLVRVVNIPYCYWIIDIIYWYWNGKLVFPVVSYTFWSTWAFTIFIFVGSVPYCHVCTNMHTFRANRCADIKCEEILQMMRTRPLWYSRSRVRLQCLMDKTQPADWRKLLEVSSSPVYSKSSSESQK